MYRPISQTLLAKTACTSARLHLSSLPPAHPLAHLHLLYPSRKLIRQSNWRDQVDGDITKTSSETTGFFASGSGEKPCVAQTAILLVAMAFCMALHVKNEPL